MSYLRKLAPLISAAIFLAAAYVVYQKLYDFKYHEVARFVRTLPPSRIALAIVLTACNYAVLALYDVLGNAYLHSGIAPRKSTFASFVAYALNNNVGLSGVVGNGLRYRLYSSWGLSAPDIARIIGFGVLTFWLGFFSLSGSLFIAEPVSIPAAIHFPVAQTLPLGVMLLVLPVTYFSVVLTRTAPFRVHDWEFAVPSRPVAGLQLLVSATDWMLAAAALYVLLPPGARVAYPHLLAIFLLAQCAGLVSNVPGGLGVFEAIILLFLSHEAPASTLVGALLAYRAVYYLLPLGVATAMLTAGEVRRRREGMQRIVRGVGQAVPYVIPQVFAVMVFLSGAMLLFSGATPGIMKRLTFLEDLLPLPVVEISHLAGSFIGASLLILARGLQRRLNGAYVMTLALLGMGVAASLLKGLDWEEASILAVMLILLIPCRSSFYRRSQLVNEPFSGGWIAAVVLILACSIWIGLFSYKHIDYSHSLWLRFGFHANAARFLRATLVASTAAVAFGMMKLLTPARVQHTTPPDEQIELAARIAAKSASTAAYLALLRDKVLMFNDARTAFVMYRVEGRSWVAMGDPIGEDEERVELAWRFREECDRHGGWPVFYEVHRDNLPLYIDLGLGLIKTGEEACVDLDTFTIDGGEIKSLRRTVRKIESEGFEFSVAPPEGIPPLLGELHEVSSRWLEEKNTREKRFSLGFFDAEYLKCLPVAIVRKEGRIVAFANVWPGGNRHELSIDMMRFRSDAPSGVMDFLFVNLMRWGKKEGFERFNLGIAPLSGLEERKLGPLWNRIGALAFHHGEHFYNFQGLRQYKEKFNPQWSPVYLAAPKGLSLPIVLANVAALISGTLKGAVTK